MNFITTRIRSPAFKCHSGFFDIVIITSKNPKQMIALWPSNVCGIIQRRFIFKDFLSMGSKSGNYTYLLYVPRRLDPFVILTYCIKWVTTSWTDGIYNKKVHKALYQIKLLTKN